jgi:glycosyltransferase involved in cell wall biosynthesis
LIYKSTNAYLGAKINLKSLNKMGKAVLYISYDGMLEPLGQSQVLSYLKCLASNRQIHLVSFEKSVDWVNVDERDRIANDIAAAGIVWHTLHYHKSPSALATAWDVVCGISLGLWLVLRHRIGVVHARSYVPSVMALTIKWLVGVKYIFDMRGFWADERVDGGLWSPSGRMYRLAKGLERQFLLSADHVVSLTHAAEREIQHFDYLQGRMPDITVISTCANLNHFKPMPCEHARRNLVLGYVGTVGTWYLFDEVARCFALLLTLRPDAKFLIVNRNEHTYIRDRLDMAGIPYSAVELIAVTHAEVPKQMSRMDAGVFFIKPVFSKQASAPTKLAEFLGCGIPCLSNAGVGDMAEVLEKDQVGIAITSFDDKAMIVALKQLINLVDDPASSDHCVASAHKHFSLDKGVRLYDEIYKKLF